MVPIYGKPFWEGINDLNVCESQSMVRKATQRGVWGTFRYPLNKAGLFFFSLLASVKSTGCIYAANEISCWLDPKQLLHLLIANSWAAKKRKGSIRRQGPNWEHHSWCQLMPSQVFTRSSTCVCLINPSVRHLQHWDGVNQTQHAALACTWCWEGFLSCREADAHLFISSKFITSSFPSAD